VKYKAQAATYLSATFLIIMRAFIPVVLFSFCLSGAFGQAAMIKQGTVFERSGKNMFGDLHNVINGVLADNGSAVIHVYDMQVQKVVRLDANLVPAEELLLKDIPLDGLLYEGVTSLVVDGKLYCLLVAQGKKAASYAIGAVEGTGTPTLSGLRKIATSELPYVNDPTNALIFRPNPDPVLLSQGLKFAQTERIIPSPDGQHFLLNNYTNDARGYKQFWFAYLDKDFKELWSGTKELSLVDEKSRIHQLSVSNDGTMHLLAYNFRCEMEEQMRDKLCHELHFITLADQGKTISDLLLEKDFVSTARFCERDSGRVTIAMRYGALTGQPGLVMTFDPLDPKLKTNPVVDQRAASIHKTKLMAYGSIEAGAKKGGPVSRIAKVPDEIVDIQPSWNNGVVVVESFLDDALQIPMGEAIVMRRLAGDLRISQVAANDSIQWQHIVERAHMTTAGRSYEGVDVEVGKNGITLLYDHTPKGLDAIMISGAKTHSEATVGKGKDDKTTAPAEAGVLKMIAIDPTGTVINEGTAVLLPDGMMPCPLRNPTNGSKYLVKSFDRENKYQYTLVDLDLVGK